jgi:capsular polysaccharide biosynthesis protein
MASEGVPGSLRLADYGALLRRQWSVVVAAMVVGAVLAGAYLAVAPREYTSATSVLVTAANNAATSGPARATINLDTEAQLVTSTETVSAAAAGLGLAGQEAEDLRDRTTVTVPPNTDILTISFVAPTAEEAQAGARAFAQAYLDARRASTEAALDAEYDALQSRIDEVAEQLRIVTEAIAALPANSPLRASSENQAAALSNQLAGLGSQQNQVRASAVQPGRVVTEPSLPSSPSSPDVPMTLVAGALLGLLLGIGLAALRHRADDAIRTADDLSHRTAVPTVGVLTAPLHEGEVFLTPAASADGRVYVRLRNLVTSGLEQRSSRVVLVAGVRRGGGPVAANLAASLARAGEDVCLVCADVFGDTAPALLGRAAGAGLAEVLAGDQPLDQALRRVPDLPGLRVLGPGKDPDRADALLQTRVTRKLLDRLQETVSYIVVEVPQTTDGTAAQTLVSAADLCLLVVETGSTRAVDVADAVGQLETAQRPVLGAVVVAYDETATPVAAPAPPVGPAPSAGRARDGVRQQVAPDLVVAPTAGLANGDKRTRDRRRDATT